MALLQVLGYPKDSSLAFWTNAVATTSGTTNNGDINERVHCQTSVTLFELVVMQAHTQMLTHKSPQGTMVES